MMSIEEKSLPEQSRMSPKNSIFKSRKKETRWWSIHHHLNIDLPFTFCKKEKTKGIQI